MQEAKKQQKAEKRKINNTENQPQKILAVLCWEEDKQGEEEDPGRREKWPKG